MGDSGPSESQAGDDPATFDDEGVGYGNINTTTEQALRDDPTIGGDDFTAADAAAARANIEKQLETQAQVDSLQQLQDQKVQEKIAQQQAFAQQQADRARQILQDTIEEEKGTVGELTIADLTPNVTATVPTTFTQGSIFDVDDFIKATDDRDITQRGTITQQTIEDLLNVTPNVKDMMRGQPDAFDFNISGSKAAADLRKAAEGPLSKTQVGLLGPIGLAINALSGMKAKSTLADLDKGMVPDFQNMKGGQIQGTTGKGFGANQTAGYIGGLSINAPGAPGGLNTLPIANIIEPMETDEGDTGETVQQQMKKPKEPTDPCPDGYKLIDGKCTIIEDPSKGTGFITFPPDKNPPFQTGPFEPKSKATPIVGISGLNPITFNNPFRR